MWYWLSLFLHSKCDSETATITILTSRVVCFCKHYKDTEAFLDILWF